MGLDDSSITSSSYIYIYCIYVLRSCCPVSELSCALHPKWLLPFSTAMKGSQDSFSILQPSGRTAGKGIHWQSAMLKTAHQRQSYPPLACALAGLGRYTDAERCPQKCEMLSHVVSSCSRVAQRPSKGKSKLECWLSLPEIAEKCLQITLMTHDGVQSIEGFHPDLFLSTSLRERHPVPQNARHVSTKKPTKSHHPVCTSLANDTHSGCEAHRIWLAVLVATLHPLHTSLDIWPFTSKLLNALT